MANPEHLKILEQGVEAWNKWREENPEVRPDLSGENLRAIELYHINLRGANLIGTNLSFSRLYKADLSRANLNNADLSRAKLGEADLRWATLINSDMFKVNLHKANLYGANLSGGVDLQFSTLTNAEATYVNFSQANLADADLSNAILESAQLYETNLTNAKLIGANLKESVLESAILVKTDLSNADINDAKIFGISVWDISKENLSQKNLKITEVGTPKITVDDLEVAQFIYLMLNNRKIRDVIETITSKAVLILGRFTEERKAVLDALKDELRRRNYLPIVFDFENAGNKSVDETVNLLARMSRFVVADITDAKSIPQELKGFVEANATPVIPLIFKGQSEYGMFDHFRKYHWVLPLHEYESPAVLLENIIPVIIAPAEQKVIELRRT